MVGRWMRENGAAQETGGQATKIPGGTVIDLAWRFLVSSFR